MNESEFTLSDLVALARYRSQGIDITEEDEERYRDAEEKINAVHATFEDAVKETLEIRKKTNVMVDPNTIFQMINELQLNAPEERKRLYDILIDDIASAYTVIEGQLKGVLPGWENEYFLRDIDVQMITEDGVWQQYVYENKFDSIRLPGCSSILVPICLRFRKDRAAEETNHNPWTTEIRFLDVLCLVTGNKVKRVQLLQCANVTSKYDGPALKDELCFKGIIITENKKRYGETVKLKEGWPIYHKHHE